MTACAFDCTEAIRLQPGLADAFATCLWGSIGSQLLLRCFA